MLQDLQRHTRFLVQRLKAMGIHAKATNDERSAEGRLLLSATPFETLSVPFRAETAHFYTLGHARLKFFEPSTFFELSALDVSRCETATEIETALRRAWAARLNELRKAKAWLEELGADLEISDGGRLLLTLEGMEGAHAVVQGPAEIHVPSSGPLAELSLKEPGERRYRPLRHLEHAIDLEIGLSEAIDQLGKRHVAARRADPEANTQLEPDARIERRVLVLDHDRGSLSATRALLNLHGFRVAAFQDPRRALNALSVQSFDLVLADVRLPRFDGLEFTARVAQLAGVENLPVVLMDDRPSAARKRAALAVGVANYFTKPLRWSEIGYELVRLVERTNLRRYERFELRLPVCTQTETGTVMDTADQVGRGGFRLRTQRQLSPGDVERYRIMLPDPLSPIEVEGQVVSSKTCPGYATVQLGIRFLRFFDDNEPQWMRFIEALARDKRSAEGS